MATGPFQYNPATREFTRRGSARGWPVEDSQGAELASLADGLQDRDAEGVDAPIGALVNPTPIRRRRRSYAASDAPPKKKSKVWRVAMWGLIIVLLIGWLVMIAVLTNRSNAGGAAGREFRFDRGTAVEPESIIAE